MNSASAVNADIESCMMCIGNRVSRERDAWVSKFFTRIIDKHCLAVTVGIIKPKLTIN